MHAQNQINLLSIVALSAMLLTACGPSRSVQCNKIVNVVNSTASKLQAGSGTATQFVEGARLAKQASTDLDVLIISDKKLKNIKSHLSAAYQEMGKTSADMATITDATTGSVTSSDPTSDAIVSRWNESSKKFTTVMNGMQSYCSGGNAPLDITSVPAPAPNP